MSNAKCSSCQEEYSELTEPVFLCQHTFCANCSAQAVHRASQSVSDDDEVERCPTCRAPSPERNSVSKLFCLVKLFVASTL